MRYNVYIVLLSIVFGFGVEGMSPQEDLFRGAQEGSLKLIESALERGAQIDAPSSFGKTALHWAANNGNFECLRALLKKGAQIEKEDTHGRRALHWAAYNGNFKCLRALLKEGAQIDTGDSVGRTPLHWAAYKDNLECLRALLKEGAQLQTKDKFEKTPLLYASATCQIDCIRTLLLAEAHIVSDGTNYKFIAPSKDKVELSRRRLKVALLALRYAGSESDGPKSKNVGGDLIVSDDYVRPWLLLSQSEVREDVFIVLMGLMAEGKKVDYPLFRMAYTELGDYLITKLKNVLCKIPAFEYIASANVMLSREQVSQMEKLCNLTLIEENFGELIRTGIKARFNELLRADSQESTAFQSSSSTQSTSLEKEVSAKKQ